MTPIERAARALYKQIGSDFDPFAEGEDAKWSEFIPQVRAVITAIREPGSDIFQAGFDAEATANPHKTQPHHIVPAVWQAMIDALLAEGE